MENKSIQQGPSWEANILQLVRELPAFLGPWVFIAEFTVRYLALSWARFINSPLFHPISLRLIPTLPNLRPIFPFVSNLQVAHPKLCLHLSSPPYVSHVPPISCSLIWSSNNISWRDDSGNIFEECEERMRWKRERKEKNNERELKKNTFSDT